MCNGDSKCAVGCQTASHKLRHVSAISTSSPTGLFVSIGFSFKREEKNQGLIRGFLLVLIPSGYVKIAIENGPVEIVDLPINSGGSFHSNLLVYQRVWEEYGVNPLLENLPILGKWGKSTIFFFMTRGYHFFSWGHLTSDL